MPYLQNFAVGEFFRRGVMGPPEPRLGIQVFLTIYSMSQYSIFAPVYWYWMMCRSLGKPIATEHRPELVPNEDPE